MDKLELFNETIKRARPISGNEVQATSLDEPINEIGIDSLDVIMISVYFSEIYGVTEEKAKELQPTTPGQFFELYEQHATKHPKTVKEALDNIEF
jgi:acyl carrier protein